MTGEEADADVTPTGPAALLMGGSTDVDEALKWWMPYAAGGDVVVLRVSGADGYNDYLYKDIGACDSVETMLVTTPVFAANAYVAWRIRHAEAIFIAGGDQADYLTLWKDSEVEDALMDAWKRGAAIGGTSAGCAVLGELMFAAYNGSVYSDEALLDPYNTYMTLERDFLALPPVAGVITDSHFRERDRMGRLVGFLGRIVQDGWASAPIGVGVDEMTALGIDPAGQGKVFGAGAVYVVKTSEPPAVCQPGQPLDFAGLTVHKLSAGDTVLMPAGDTMVPGLPLAAKSGALIPADPY
jgi:cyanophycinase